MNKENYDQILEALDTIGPRKAKKFRELIRLEEMESDPEIKSEYHQKVWNYLYNLFLSCLTRESKNSIVNAGVSINELCYLIGMKAQDGWQIYSSGALRLEKLEDGFEIVGDIPREYGKGFLLKERIPETEKDVINAKKELDFYTRFEQYLAVLSGEMDYKETFLRYGYQIKDSRIPREFVELLIETLGLARVNPEDVKMEQSTK